MVNKEKVVFVLLASEMKLLQDSDYLPVFSPSDTVPITSGLFIGLPFS